MFILILIIAVIVLYWLVKGGLSVLGGAIEGAQNLIDPQTTDESAGPLIARAAGKVAKLVYPTGGISVVEFIPKEKSMSVEVTSTEDIELIKGVKDKNEWEVTVLNKYKKTYWEGTLVFDVQGFRKKHPLQGIIYTDEENRGGFAVTSKEWEEYLKTALLNEYPSLSEETDINEETVSSKPTVETVVIRGVELPVATVERIKKCWKEGDKIGAIGAYKDATGVSLADAKWYVEKIVSE